jgi:MarR family transcriptional regulator for hemolysin
MHENDLQAEFSFALHRLARSWRQSADRALDELGLSDATAWALINLDRLGEGVRQNQLAEAMAIEGSSLVRLLDHLCAAGLVTRREDEADRRAKTLHFTEAGRAAVGALTAHLGALRRELLAGVPEARLREAISLIGQLQRAVDAREGRR